MPKSIILRISHPTIPDGPIRGFRFMWAFYVNGYRPETHCQRCFKGRRVAEFSTGTARSGASVALDLMDRYPYVYVCGVGVGPKTELHQQNLHLPLRYKEGAKLVERETYNGYVFQAENAEEIEIAALPDDWMGLPREHARCKNYQFAVGVFGAV